MTSVVPYTITVSDEILKHIRDRIREFPWEVMADAGGWSAGVSIAYMQSLAHYWLNKYDWRVAEEELNRLPQFLASVEDQKIHFVHVKGSGSKCMPLLLCHGWPGSFFEFSEIVEKLAHPERFGGSKDDAFDVVVPSLPGFGFSGPPRHPIGPRAIAGMFETLMTKELGYEHFIAQGGDWGAHVAGWLGYRYARSCRAIHLNMLGLRNSEMLAPRTETEKEWTVRLDTRFRAEGAYLLLQVTKPQTLAFALADNPVGVAAWIVEKFASWSDIPLDAKGAPKVCSRFSEEQLLTNIMIYLISGSFATSTWIYRGFVLEQPPHIAVGQGIPPQMDSDSRIEVPVGFAAFPDPVYCPPPRSVVERGYNVVHWTDMPRGGHFAAMEEPELFVEDVRKFARSLR